MSGATGRDGRPVALAAVAGAHGVRGEVRLKLFADSIDSLRRFREFEADGRVLVLDSVRDGPSGPVARFAGVTDRNAAETLRGTTLSVMRSQLPPLEEGEYYWHDLIGLPVFSPDGETQGEVISVDNYGASDVLEVKRVKGGSVLVPMIADAVDHRGDRLVIGTEWLA